MVHYKPCLKLMIFHYNITLTIYDTSVHIVLLSVTVLHASLFLLNDYKINCHNEKMQNYVVQRC